MGNKESIANSPNRTDTILPRNNKLCFPSCRPKELHSNITIPRPFSFSKEKRAVTEKRPSTGLKGSGSGKFNSKTTVTSTSVGHGKDKLPLQVSLLVTIAFLYWSEICTCFVSQLTQMSF